MATSDWAPLVADVGAILRARTKDSNGNELGTFTANTRPTEDQVDDLIETAMSDIESDVGSVPDVLQDAARRVAAIGTALHVELSFFPEQIANGRSPYDQLKELYDERFARLKAQIDDVNAGGDVGGGSESDVPMPVYSFPELNSLGWSTQW
jgi:hypothetical protein